ncbi:DUF4907 domain-containing protein [[Flexibacter] sp. ATCC 35103]|uniref:DUF4907 domain-containing protein n=1 Tax=[Flexibacter] sp. ATCC 35103 TaxID=1937528 RepID=UPI0009D35265|nr:DUF4907 domain-containing protein [[Flexibacter] sp. ATCC 35103]OMQ11146.1 DUF4907 domain-containing protein [[Flexibacter] sp. ATCC 35103]
MIINIKKQFFWNKIQKNLLFILLVLQFTACVKHEKFKSTSFKTTTGWGYTVAFKNKIIIKQSVIPVINDTKSFSTESDALKVADLVVEKLNQKISPTVTKNDLILLKIKL